MEPRVLVGTWIDPRTEHFGAIMLIAGHPAAYAASSSRNLLGVAVERHIIERLGEGAFTARVVGFGLVADQSEPHLRELFDEIDDLAWFEGREEAAA